MQVKRILSLLYFLCFIHSAKAQTAESLLIEEQTVAEVSQNFGASVKTVEQALALIKREYAPVDGRGRTFAIIEATGNKLPNGKMQLSLRISTEKAGSGKLVLKTNNKVLWQATIKARDGKNAGTIKGLTINIEQEGADKGKLFTAEGSAQPTDIFLARLLENKKTVDQTWTNGTVKEVVFVYSTCGCPVHTRFLRNGNRAIPQNKNQVIFPDDAEMATLIRRLMNY